MTKRVEDVDWWWACSSQQPNQRGRRSILEGTPSSPSHKSQISLSYQKELPSDQEKVFVINHPHANFDSWSRHKLHDLLPPLKGTRNSRSFLLFSFRFGLLLGSPGSGLGVSEEPKASSGPFFGPECGQLGTQSTRVSSIWLNAHRCAATSRPSITTYFSHLISVQAQQNGPGGDQPLGSVLQHGSPRRSLCNFGTMTHDLANWHGNTTMRFWELFLLLTWRGRRLHIATATLRVAVATRSWPHDPSAARRSVDLPLKGSLPSWHNVRWSLSLTGGAAQQKLGHSNTTSIWRS